MSLARPGRPSRAQLREAEGSPGCRMGQGRFALDGFDAAVLRAGIRREKKLTPPLPPKRSRHRAEEMSYLPPLPPLIWSTPPIFSMGRLDQPRPPRPLHLSIRWVAWTNPALTSTPPIFSMGLLDQPRPPGPHSTYLFFGSLGPTSAPTSTPPIYLLGRLDQLRPLMSVSRRWPYCRQVCRPPKKACKGCKGKRGPLEPSFSHPEKPSSSRQKTVF